MRRRFVTSLVLLAVAVACGGDPASPPEASYAIAIHGGSGQQGPAGSILEQPLQVTITDVANQPVQGVVVSFRSLSGGGTLTDTTGVTGVGGIALTYARLGGAVGPHRFEAFMARAPKARVTFEVEATPGATLVRIEPASVEAGDTVSVIGTNFNDVLSGNRVYFGSAEGRVLSGTGDTELRAVVPACAGPGPVTVRVAVGSATTNLISVPYATVNPLVALAVGEGLTVGASEIGECLQLQGAGPRYLVVPQFASAIGDTLAASFRIGREGTAVAGQAAMPAGPVVLSPQQEIDAEMRRIERDIAPLVAMQGEPDAQPLEALTLNSTRSFHVITTLPRGTTPMKFGKSAARLKYIGTHILVYVDVAAPSEIAPEDLIRIGELFDTQLYNLTVTRFGSESDLDRNGKVIVLMSQSVNGLTPRTACATGFTAGYFYPNDLYFRNQNSNKGEIFYTIVPDPAGAVSCQHSIASVLDRIPTVFVHELQHMISFNQHVIARGGSTEDVWLGEGLSLIAEEMVGRYYEEAYPPASGQLFADSAAMFVEDVLKIAYDYLFASKSYSVTTFKEFGGLQERGAAWLFLRWLGDQKGNQIYSRLVQTRMTSVENVEDKAGESFPALFGDFALAAAADIPGFARATLDDRYRFQPRPRGLDYATVFRQIGKFLPSPVQFAALQPYATATTQSMVQGTMAFFSVSTASLPEPALALRFTAPGGSAFPAAFRAQVGVVRVQ